MRLYATTTHLQFRPAPIALHPLAPDDLNAKLPMPPLAEQKQRFDALTSARFFAALLVLLMHFSDFVRFPAIIMPVIASGGIGVTFFFVLSGFVLYHSYGKQFESKLSAKEYVHFFLKRFFRIYPAYLLALLLVTFVNFYVGNVERASNTSTSNLVLSWIANLLALQTFAGNVFTQQFWNAPAWSISTEFVFYLVFPVFVYGVVKRCNGVFLLLTGIVLFFLTWSVLRTGVVFGAFAGWFEKTFWVDYLSERNAAWRIWEFFIGVFAAKLHLQTRGRWLNAQWQRNTVLVMAIGAVLFVAFGAVLYGAYVPWPVSERFLLLARVFMLGILNALPFAAMILVLASGKCFISPLMDNKLMVHLGECSFALYIYHWIFWLILSHIKLVEGAVDVGMVMLMMLAALATSLLSYNLYEQPIRWWAYRRLTRLFSDDPSASSAHVQSPS